MSELSRFGVSVEEELLQKFDRLIYDARSEALRDLMRDAIVKAKVESAAETDELVGSVTLVYDHHARDLNGKMNELQHKYHRLIGSVLHVHISRDDCLEVIAMRGNIKNIRSLAEALLSLKGVKHGKLFVTPPAQKITASKKSLSGNDHRH